MCFCTACFETYAAYVLLVAKHYEETGWFVLLRFPWVNKLNNNVHLSWAHQRPERSHDTY